MIRFILFVSFLTFSISSYCQVQVQSAFGLSEIGINTLIQKSISKNNKFNYYNHSNFEMNTTKDTAGKTEFFHVIDYKLVKCAGLALGNTITNNEVLPELGLAFAFTKKKFDFNFYPTVNYSFKTNSVGFGANGMASYSPKISKNFNLYNLLILGADFGSDNSISGNQTLLAGLEYKNKIDFGVSLNLANQQEQFNTDIGLFLGIKIFNFNTDEQPTTFNLTPNKMYQKSTIEYTMPDESEPHEGTWLHWPHQYQFGITYRNRLDSAWLAMTKALAPNEMVHIVAYDEIEKERITTILNKANIPLTHIDFKIYKTDDVWARDTGPIYTKDKNGKLVIQDWGFNGWGKKFKFENCNTIPSKIAIDQKQEIVDLNAIMILEGGSVEIDGNGTLMATKSAILNKNRNPKMTQEQAEIILNKYYGVVNFIWLEGVAGLEITDMHIDGFAKFANKNNLVTMSENDLLEWQVPANDIIKLYNSKNAEGQNYKIVTLPLTQNEVTTEYGKKLGYKGSYCNYYIANNIVLVPNYNDSNDTIANAIIQELYPNRKVIGIDVRNLYANGGMIHCVTQQQPK